MSSNWKPEPFTSQDQELAADYRRIQRFRAHKAKDLTHGLWINVRETLSLDNSLVEVIRLDGRPSQSDFDLGLKYYRARSVQSAADVNADYYNHYGSSTHGGIHTSTLCTYHQAYKFNNEVRQFFKRFQAAGRFQQHCLFRNKPYTDDTYQQFCTDVKFRHWSDKELSSIDWDSGYDDSDERDYD